MDVENLESPKKRKRNKYPVGQKKRHKVISSRLKRGRKPKKTLRENIVGETSQGVSETLTECFRIVNCVDGERTSENFDANAYAGNNDDSGKEISVDGSNSENSDGNLGEIRLFSSEKHFGQVNSGESAKSKYKPNEG